MARAGWKLIGYALMSNHVHLLAVASEEPLSAWARPAHVGMAQWLNARFGRLGPVFAGRPYCEMVSPRAVPIVLAYVHNNPVRAHVVAHAAQSTWTSHRAYLGLEGPAGGLDIPYGLALAGFSDDATGRSEFSDWVDACASAKSEGITSRAQLSALLSTARKRLGATLELGTATRDQSTATFQLLVPSVRTLPSRIELDPDDVLRAVFAVAGVDLREPVVGRPRSVSLARRAALKLWTHTRQPRSMMIRALGISPAAASELASTTSPRDAELAHTVGKALDLLVPDPASLKAQVWSGSHG